jgi:hypothetical protein
MMCVYFIPLVVLMHLLGFEILNRVGLCAASKSPVLRPRKEGPWIDPSSGCACPVASRFVNNFRRR